MVNNWSEEEEKILKSEWSEHIQDPKSGIYKKIQGILNDSGYERTCNAIKRKRERMGLKSVDRSEYDDQHYDEDGEYNKNKLSKIEKHFISLLPCQKDDIKRAIGISDSTFSQILFGLKEKHDISIKYHEADDEYKLKDKSHKRRLSTTHKQTISQNANDYRTEAEADVLRRLNQKPPLKCGQDPKSENEDLVAALSDVHWGDLVEDEHGNEVYNSNIASASSIWWAKKVLRFKERHEQFTDFDTMHLILGGDMATNENIYRSQPFDLDSLLADQMSLAIDHLVHIAETFAKKFDTLQIVAVQGNHGQSRSSYKSKQANMDLVAYRNMCDRLIDRGYDNINFIVGEAKHYRKFELRGGRWEMLLHHGQNEKLHVDSTASSKSSDRGNVIAHDVDGFIRGHYHTQRYTEIMNQYPVIQLPSPKPGDEFAEKIDRPDVSVHRKLGAVWRCSDERLMSSYPMFIDDVGFDKALKNNEIEYTTKEEIRERYNNNF